MSKKISIIGGIVAVLIILSLIFSIYIPNKKKIEKEKEEKSASYYLLKQDNKFGVIDEKGNKIIEPKYTEIIIPNIHKAVFLCYEDENEIVLDQKGSKILTKFNNIEAIKLENIISESAYEKNVLKYEKDGKFGLLSLDGEIIVEAKYDEISSLGYKQGEILIKENDKYGIIDDKGKRIIKTEYDEITSDQYYNTEDGYKKSGYIVRITTQDGYRYGYFDYEGGKVLETEYNQIIRLTQIPKGNEAYLIASKNGQYGFFVNNNKIINTQYQSISYDNGIGMFIVERTGKFGAINEKGMEILKPEYSDLQINGIYMYTQKDDEEKIFDKNGNEVNIAENTTIEATSSPEYFIKIEQNETENYTLLNSKLEELTTQKYQYLEYLFGNYFIATNTDGKAGIIDDKENTIVEFQFDLIQTIKDKNVIQAINFETNITKIYNNEIKEIEQIKDIHIQNLNDYIKIYNDETEIYLDNNGNKIEDENRLEEIRKNNAILRINNFKRVTYGVEQYYYVEEGQE